MSPGAESRQDGAWVLTPNLHVGFFRADGTAEVFGRPSGEGSRCRDEVKLEKAREPVLRTFSGLVGVLQRNRANRM